MHRITLGLVALASGCAPASVEQHSPVEPQPTRAPLVAQATGPSREALARTLSEASRDAVARSPITPLFFGTARDAGGATITAGPHFYAVSLQREGHSLALHGVDVVHAEPGEDTPTEAHGDTAANAADDAHEGARTAVRGRPATILVNEGIRSVAWEEDGAYWSLEVECFRAFEDARCTGDAYALAEAAALVSLRGAR